MKSKSGSLSVSGGNVFADMGLQDADTHLVKAQLVGEIAETIRQAKLSQNEAAERMGLSQPDVSKMLRGQFRPMSIERLMVCLVALGKGVKISVDAKVSRKAELEIA